MEKLDIWKIIGISIIICVILTYMALTAKADTLPDKTYIVPQKHHINDSKAILAVIGEAEDQGDVGRLAVACAIRNRGTLEGVRGLTSQRVRKHLYSENIKLRAKMAWDISNQRYADEWGHGICDFINGATGWGNPDDLIEIHNEAWFKNYKIVYHYNAHWFYRKD